MYDLSSQAVLSQNQYNFSPNVFWPTLYRNTLPYRYSSSVCPFAAEFVYRPADKIIIDKIESIAKSRQIPMAQVALAWSLQSPWVTAPIIGVRSNERLDELLEGMKVTLTEEELKGINEPYQPLKIRGHA